MPDTQYIQSRCGALQANSDIMSARAVRERMIGMAVFISASDENAGKTHRDRFLFAGWIGPEEDWSRFFAPAWQEPVLDGLPAIPYLHMTELRSPQWRARYGLSRLQADDRVDEAFVLIDTMQSLFPLGVSLDAGLLRDKFATARVVSSTAAGAPKPFDPDYLCFLYYAYLALAYVDSRHPEAHRLDFIVERKGHVTKYIQGFHATLAATLAALGKPSYARLVGELIPGDEDCVPLQAADVLCCHTARYQQPETMDAADLRRYAMIAHRQGEHHRISRAGISQLEAAMLPYGV